MALKSYSFVPGKCSATNRLIAAKDVKVVKPSFVAVDTWRWSVQSNVPHDVEGGEHKNLKSGNSREDLSITRSMERCS